MLVCLFQHIDWIVCLDCGSVFRWHSSGKHNCLVGPTPKISYDDIIPKILDNDDKDDQKTGGEGVVYIVPK